MPWHVGVVLARLVRLTRLVLTRLTLPRPVRIVLAWILLTRLIRGILPRILLLTGIAGIWGLFHRISPKALPGYLGRDRLQVLLTPLEQTLCPRYLDPAVRLSSRAFIGTHKKSDKALLRGRRIPVVNHQAVQPRRQDDRCNCG